jgi:catechol 2,3-dioxygenase-like lactoylglutathione lyase family enzyme
MSFLSHVHVGVTDIERARRFYDPLMRELGLRLRNVELANGWIAWRLCPLAWCSFGVATTITGLGRIDQAARVGRLTRGSSPIGAMLSRVM